MTLERKILCGVWVVCVASIAWLLHLDGFDSKILLFFVSWLVCGFLAYGATVAYFRTEYAIVAEETWGTTKSLAICMFFAGIGGLGISFFMSGFWKHGFMWRL